MTETRIDLATWPRADHYRLFKTFAQPHFAITTRLDVTRLVTDLKPKGISPFRACLFAIASGIHTVPELRCRLRPDDVVVQHDQLVLGPTIALDGGGFGFGYIPFDPDFSRFDPLAKAEIEAVRRGDPRPANLDNRDDFIYMSCVPWVDFTSLTNALPGVMHSIPNAAWGKFTPGADGRITCALSLEVHHAIADGAHVGAAFLAIQDALDAIKAPR